ncbi:DUF5719 family protein [Streptacidiphilus monticola]|uniref:DUF5719 family protein n=1 Tax=Streptacidiphilus monticola TaxID=2161674 RepID=A0ABW1G6E5_9ACTN
MRITRTTQSLLAALGVLAVALGIAEVNPPSGEAAASGRTVRTAVAHRAVLCPNPLQSGSASTGYAVAAPGAPAGVSVASGSSGSGGTAGAGRLGPLGGAGTALAQLSATGGATAGKAPSGAKAPALALTADGGLAPGLTGQQTTVLDGGKSLSGLSCTEPATDFWFAGADTAKGDTDTLVLSNNESTNAYVDVQAFGATGEVESTQAGNISVPADGSVALPLSRLVNAAGSGGVVSLHVLVRSGRVAAALNADSGSTGADWIPPTELSSTVVLPGLPGDVKHAVLAVTAPGVEDADLKLQLASQTGWITPAGHETIHVKAGMLTFVDLADVTRGQPAALRLSPTDPKQAPGVVAAIQLGRGSSSTELAYTTGTDAVTQRTTIAGNTAAGTTLFLTATDKAATVTVAALGKSGSPQTQEVKLQPGTTVAIKPKSPDGADGYALTVEPAAGSGPVYVARMLTSGKAGFTVQPYADDHSTVEVPRTIQAPAILLP